MNPHAFEIIEGLGLRHPVSYNIDDAIKSQKDLFFLRYCRNEGKYSCLVDKKGLMNRKNELEGEISAGRLLEIEESFKCIAGCAVYINMDGIYGEYVDGHLVALLRRGICKKRFFIDKKGNVSIKEAFQGFEAVQTKKGYKWKLCSGAVEKESEIIEYLMNKISIEQKDLLLEILITEKEIVVCDAKHPKMEMSWRGMQDIFGTCNSEIYLKSVCCKKMFQENSKIDGFDIDLSQPEQNIIVGNGAILSHYVTRNYDKYNSIRFV